MAKPLKKNLRPGQQYAVILDYYRNKIGWAEIVDAPRTEWGVSVRVRDNSVRKIDLDCLIAPWDAYQARKKELAALRKTVKELHDRFREQNINISMSLHTHDQKATVRVNISEEDFPSAMLAFEDLLHGNDPCDLHADLLSGD